MNDYQGLQLLIAPRSPFCRKVVACIAEAGLQDQIALQIVDPWTDERLRAANPLCKVPTLMLTDGTALFDSAVIVQYIQDRSGAALIPRGESRWDALRREAQADGLADAVIRRFVERSGSDGDRASKVVRRQEQAIDAALGRFEQAPAWVDLPVDVGHIALACAIDYLNRRSPELDWSAGRPLLVEWFYDFRTRPSFVVASSTGVEQSGSIVQG
ncbi:glutathione S-transferase family protein [Methylobacterium sp. PvR107]|uniref:glutathione S-transferase family protein n=1 Tax=Methylobacterium sp. PvR107 TaxID=2806597 RepID=UPI001AE27EC1|nr:glutathione S-transferase N-terminal domain-containing protein [Methylobacterium sp. PvR107]MBP1178486.1 glutathione S-transferase [Methylobacterium sp. PvR107]